MLKVSDIPLYFIRSVIVSQWSTLGAEVSDVTWCLGFLERTRREHSCLARAIA